MLNGLGFDPRCRVCGDPLEADLIGPDGLCSLACQGQEEMDRGVEIIESVKAGVQSLPWQKNVPDDYYVYQHREPYSGRVFYIGKGVGLRCFEFAPSQRSDQHAEHLAKIRAQGYAAQQIVSVLPMGPEDLAVAWEGLLIRACRNSELLNQQIPGRRTVIAAFAKCGIRIPQNAAV